MLDMLKWLPENVSTYGADIDRLFYLIYYITGFVFLLVHVLLVGFAVRYRRGARPRAVYSHGNTALEIAWTVVPALIVVLLAVLSKPTWDKVKRELPPADQVVRVTAKQFNWEVQYPGPDGRFDTDDDLVLENDLEVPVDAVVHVRLRSRDVIHSFFLPHLRLKQDAVPGREIVVWFQATRPGRYEIPCAELCGFGHSGMKGFLTVNTPEQFRAWIEEKWPATRQASVAAPVG
jgi:cytochrome c oxidase subunit 2